MLVSLSLPDGKALVNVLPANSEQWPTHELKEGEVLEVAIPVKVQEPSQAYTVTLQLGPPAAEDDEGSDESEREDVFVPARPVAE